MFVHELEESHFDLCLVEERFLVLDDLNGDLFLVHTVVGLHHLADRQRERERVITVYNLIIIKFYCHIQHAKIT